MGTIASTLNSASSTPELPKSESFLRALASSRTNQDPTKTFKEAVEQSNIPLIKDCLYLGIDINVEFEDGSTALHLAAEKCDSPVLKLLLNAVNLNINKKNNVGMTPLIKACIFNCREVVQLLLKSGADPNLSSDDGNTPLHFTCMRRNMGIVFDLVQNGAIVNRRNVFDVTPLTICVIDFPSLPIAKYIMKKGARKHGTKEFPLLLECALCCNNITRLNIFKILVSRGMDIHQLHPLENRNCLHYVAISSYLPLVNYLLTFNVDGDLAVRDASGRTPVEMAISHQNYAVYNLFRCYSYLRLKNKGSTETYDKDTTTNDSQHRMSSRNVS